MADICEHGDEHSGFINIDGAIKEPELWTTG